MRKPNKWIAGGIALVFSPPFGLLYSGRLRGALIYLAGLLLAIVIPIWMNAIEFAGILLLLIYIGGAIHAFRAAKHYPQGLIRPIYSRWYGLLGIYIAFFAFMVVVRAFLFEPFRIASGAMLPGLKPGSHVIAGKWGYGDSSAFGFTLRKGEVSATVKRGDVLIFVYPGSTERLEYVMRVVGLPGDLVEYKQKSLSINRQPVRYGDAGTYEYESQGRVVSGTLRSETLGGTGHQILIDPDAPGILGEHIHNYPNQSRCAYQDDGFTCRVPLGHYFMLGDNRDASNDSRYWGFVPQDHIVGKVVNLRP
ncbi:MAG: signal peptidase I [Gammaproteobacteria bacterium]